MPVKKLMVNKKLKVLRSIPTLSIGLQKYFINIAFAMKSKRIFLNVSSEGPRLLYVVKEIFERRLNLDCVFSSNATRKHDDLVISYGGQDGDLQIPACGLLNESNQLLFDFQWTKDQLLSEITILDGLLSIDVFGVVFWFLSRYEECQFSGPMDAYNRFPSSASKLTKLGILDFPVVDHLINSFSKILINKGLEIEPLQSKVEFSFDIDNATAYKEKGVLRNLAGFGKDIFSFRLNKIFQRACVLSGFSKDPFDNFSEIKQISEYAHYKVNIFFWVGDYGKNDRGLNWQNLWFGNEIRDLAKFLEIGIHPSFNSFGHPGQITKEIERLETVTSAKVLKNRFHFLRFQLPDSYKVLEINKIEEDFSMGFSDVFGYRAGTGHSFFWYDLKSEKATNLKIHPFVMMDSLAYFKLKLNAEHFLNEVKKARDQAEKVGGKVHIIFHNEHFSWKGWKNIVLRVNELNPN